mmetsp:Transcript_9851/g.13936  ORF Transcript_9851/g.13936 Transcript_9851/m.13936 type:complete len:223 (+) Transcript_9851:108-776(+)
MFNKTFLSALVSAISVHYALGFAQIHTTNYPLFRFKLGTISLRQNFSTTRSKPQEWSRFSTAEEYEQNLGNTSPKTFREAEVLGLRLMQEGRHSEALDVFQNGLKLPGSRPDILRTKMLSGPSPVGGSSGGTEGKKVMTLDEFELQACHYNIACAYARLGKPAESIGNLEKAFSCGFDNFATVRADPDLSELRDLPEYVELMEKYDPNRGLSNVFSIFGRKG